MVSKYVHSIRSNLVEKVCIIEQVIMLLSCVQACPRIGFGNYFNGGFLSFFLFLSL